MIKGFRSKALKNAFAGRPPKLHPDVLRKILSVLDTLHAATSFENLKGLTGFHELKGDRAGEFSITITRNWRITFTPIIERETNPISGEEEDVFHVSKVDYEDYH